MLGRIVQRIAAKLRDQKRWVAATVALPALVGLHYALVPTFPLWRALDIRLGIVQPKSQNDCVEVYAAFQTGQQDDALSRAFYQCVLPIQQRGREDDFVTWAQTRTSRVDIVERFDSQDGRLVFLVGRRDQQPVGYILYLDHTRRIVHIE